MRKIKRGQIYYADLPKGIGSEQGGCRPVLIMQNDIGNRYSATTIVAPITSKTGKQSIPTHVPIHADGLRKSSIALLEQLRTLDKSKIGRCMGKLTEEEMAAVEHATAVSLGLGSGKL